MSRFDGSRGPPNILGMTSLKVDNLTYRTNIEDLERFFEKYGEVGDVYIPRDRYRRESRGFAFIRFYEKRDAEDAIDGLDGQIIDGRQIRVTLAKYDRPTENLAPRGRRGGSDSGGGGGGSGGGGRFGGRSSPPRRSYRESGGGGGGGGRYDRRGDRHGRRSYSRSRSRSRSGARRSRSRSPKYSPRRRSPSPKRSPSPRRSRSRSRSPYQRGSKS